MTAKLITAETLKKWDACAGMFKRFCELYPDGADLKTASEGLIADDFSHWSDWLWKKCAKYDSYRDQTIVVSGSRGTSTSGYEGTSISGDWGTSISGYEGTSTSGHEGTSTSGDWGKSTSGYEGTSISGDWGTSTSGYEGTSISGDWGKSTSGHEGTSTSGYEGTSISAHEGKVKSGECGNLILKHWNGERYLVYSANVGINGIEPDTFYKIEDGKFVKAEGGTK